ncbi:hypothetical protein BKA61DRAFT_586270 [Leptodontidium sp. MPI-SDFR-AT-0119]|nr:hypothetical protein BKA61DRAFT_586270 [Leptodontidium sp. MPI-SDFR-AT-0119]
MKYSAVLSLFMAMASITMAIPLDGQGGTSVNFLDLVKRDDYGAGVRSKTFHPIPSHSMIFKSNARGKIPVPQR